MSLYQAEYRSKERKDKSKEAIGLAMENRWEEAVEVNRSITEVFPDDVEAFNRLGKAHVELGQYDEARAAFANALQLSPSNSIAQKNLNRLTHLRSDQQAPKKARKLPPHYFLGDSGKTGYVALERPADKSILAKLAAGDAVSLRINDKKLIVENGDSEYIGLIPPRMAHRLIRLSRGGNSYEAVVTRLSGDVITIMIREVFQHPDQRGITSFPTQSEQQYSYSRAAMLDVDVQEEEGDDEIKAAFNAEWEENDEPTNPLSRQSFTQGSISDDGEEES